MIPPTSVDSEWASSAVSNFLGDIRTRMNDSTLNNLFSERLLQICWQKVEINVKLSKRRLVKYDQLIDYPYEQLIDYSSRGRIIN